MKLFGLRDSRPQAEALARTLGIGLAALEEREFEDGEFKIRPLESVRGERTVIYQSCSGSAGASVNDRLMRALVLAGALGDAGAAEIVLVAPYLAYARKDRRTKPRDPVTTRYVAQMIEAVGIDEVITVDVHNPAAFENALRCRTRNVSSAPLFVEHFTSLAADGAGIAVVAPDAGGVKRARQFADLLMEAAGREIGLGFAEKHRSEGRVTGELFAGEVSGVDVIIVDDIICGGTTVRRAAAACLARGARSVHVAATHGLFTAAAVGMLEPSLLESIVVTDTVPDVRLRGQGFSTRLSVCATAGEIARLLR